MEVHQAKTESTYIENDRPPFMSGRAAGRALAVHWLISMGRLMVGSEPLLPDVSLTSKLM